MPSGSLRRLWSHFTKKKKATPLVSHLHDLHLVRKVHKRRFPSFGQVKEFKRILPPAERRAFNIASVLFVIGFVWFGWSVLSGSRIVVPAVGGVYAEAVVGSPQLINPIFASINEVDLDISKLVYSGLMRYDNEQRLVPDIAVRYELSEDKKTYTFFLRQDVLWHDGEPLTANDVAYTIDMIQNEQVASPLIVSFQGVEVDVIDDFTISFTLPEPFSAFLTSLTVGVLPEHVWVNIPPERARLAPQNIQPIGTGPFTFQKLIKNDTGYISRYELARFTDYYRRPAYLEEVHFQFYGAYDDGGNEAASNPIQALREQKVDGLHFVPYDLREKVERKNIILHEAQLPQYVGLFFNQKRHEGLKQKDARMALAYAIDKKRILREAIRDEGKVIHGPILPGFPGYDEKIEETPYSVIKANELLDKHWNKVGADEFRNTEREARVEKWIEDYGDTFTASSSEIVSSSTIRAEAEKAIDAELAEEFSDAQLFFRQNDDEENFELTLVTADTQEYRKAATLIVGAWEELGIKTHVRYVLPKEFTREVLKDRSYDVLLYGIILGGDPDQYAFWHSDNVDHPGLNLSQYVNRQVDELLESAREAADEETVAGQSKKMQDILLKEWPAIFLYTPTYTYATADHIKGVDVERIYYPADRFSGIADWYMKTKGLWQKK